MTGCSPSPAFVPLLRKGGGSGCAAAESRHPTRCRRLIRYARILRALSHAGLFLSRVHRCRNEHGRTVRPLIAKRETPVKSSVETLEPTKVKLTVEVPFEEFKPAMIGSAHV